MKWQESDIGKRGWLTKEAAEQHQNEHVVYGFPGDEAVLEHTEDEFIHLHIQMIAAGRCFIVRVPHEYFSIEPIEVQSRT